MKRITLVRHGNTAKAAEQQPDHTRELTPVGYVQAEGTRRQLLDLFGADWKPDFVVCSDRLRAQQTAESILGIQGVDHTASIFLLPTMVQHPVPAIDAEIGEMFKDLTYSPLSAYFAKYGQHGPAKGHRIIELARINVATIEAVVAACVPPFADGVEDLFIGGHAVILPAMAYEMTNDPACLDINLDEADAIVIDKQAGTVTHVRSDGQPAAA